MLAVVATLALALQFGDGKPAGDVTVSASPANESTFSLNDTWHSTGLLIARYYEPTLPGLTGADYEETHVLSGLALVPTLMPDESGLNLRVPSGMYAWRMLPLPSLPALLAGQ